MFHPGKHFSPAAQRGCGTPWIILEGPQASPAPPAPGIGLTFLTQIRLAEHVSPGSHANFDAGVSGVHGELGVGGDDGPGSGPGVDGSGRGAGRGSGSGTHDLKPVGLHTPLVLPLEPIQVCPIGQTTCVIPPQI